MSAISYGEVYADAVESYFVVMFTCPVVIGKGDGSKGCRGGLGMVDVVLVDFVVLPAGEAAYVDRGGSIGCVGVELEYGPICPCGMGVEVV